MGKKFKVFFLVLALACFGYTAFLWGGLRDTPGVGDRLMDEMENDPGAGAYMLFGDKINGTLGLTAAGRRAAVREFPGLLTPPINPKNISIYGIKDAQSDLARWCYYLGPALLVLSFVLHLGRQKKVHSLGST